jgi:phosphoribosylanthranilate isomerase
MPKTRFSISWPRHVRPDILQLHGTEPPARVSAIKARYGLPVMKALPVADATDLQRNR